MGVIHLKAQVIRSYGDASVFQLEEVSKPVLLPGHVLIKVKATSVNPIDTKVRSGAVPAVSPSFSSDSSWGCMQESSVKLEKGVTEFKIGDEVYRCAGGFKGTGGALSSSICLADARLLST